jgi:hypothetical protein
MIRLTELLFLKWLLFSGRSTGLNQVWKVMLSH